MPKKVQMFTHVKLQILLFALHKDINTWLVKMTSLHTNSPYSSFFWSNIYKSGHFLDMDASSENVTVAQSTDNFNVEEYDATEEID